MKNLPKIMNVKKRLGRGYGSGKGGHTVGRGQKGQKSRGGVGLLFEGVKVKKSFYKRLPFVRGKTKFSAKEKPMVINLDRLVDLPKSVKVISLKSLIDADLVDASDAQKYGVKILGKGEINDKLTFELPVSQAAALKIKKAGGEIINK